MESAYILHAYWMRQYLSLELHFYSIIRLIAFTYPTLGSLNYKTPP